MRLKIQLAQIQMRVGDFEGNARQLQEQFDQAEASRADLVVAPELAVCGYPPLDWLERPEFIERSEKTIQTLIDASKGRRSCFLLGTIRRTPISASRGLANAAIAIHDGQIVFEQWKTLLPTYDIFDESRYFEPAAARSLWEWRGVRIAVGLCEDFWARDSKLGAARTRYAVDPVDDWAAQKPDLALSLSASPYQRSKQEHREELHLEVAKRLSCPLIYVNGVGAVDEVLLDGASFALNPETGVQIRLSAFEAGCAVVDFGKQNGVVAAATPLSGRASSVRTLVAGLEYGIRSYFEQSGFKQAILGLSGGIDSAVVAMLAARALGPKNVLGIAMPGPYSSPGSLRDAEALARALGMRFEVHPIKMATAFLSREWSKPGREVQGLTLENLQARLRGLTLMTLANRTNALTLATSNKSESAMGYATLYGDMCGALGPIGDLWKTEVYEVAHALNELDAIQPIPVDSLRKPPSAELRPEQKDQDSLPPYSALDPLLRLYLERQASVVELETQFESSVFLEKWANSTEHGASQVRIGWVRKTLKQVERFEFKRRQAPPVLRVSERAFGIGRRMPTVSSTQFDDL